MLALIATSGAWFMPDALNRFVFLKLTAVAAGATLAATVPARGRLPTIAVALLGAGGVLLLCAALQGATPVAQLLGRPPRYEGAFVLPVYLGALFVGARLLGPGRVTWANACLIRWLAVAAIAVGALALIEATGVRPLSSAVARPGSLLGNASDEGVWGLLALGPLLASAIAQRRALTMIGTLGAGAALVCSASRGALLGALLVLATLAVLTPARLQRAALLAVATALLTCTFTLSATRARITDSSPQSMHTATGRLLLWRETGDLLLAHPLLGVGPSGYIDAIPRYHTANYERQVGPKNPPDSPHSWVLQATSAGGPLLALIAIALAIMTLLSGLAAARSARREHAQVLACGMTAALAGYALALLFHFTSPGTTPLAALYAGSLLAVPGARRTQRFVRRRSAARAVAVVTLCCLVVIFGAGALAEIPLRSGVIAVASGHFTGAETDFRLAEDLRPWDGGVPSFAAHAYATLAQNGVSAAARPAGKWSQLELSDSPNSIQAFQDAAAAAIGLGERSRSAQLLTAGLHRDPHNGQLLLALARPHVEIQLGELQHAVNSRQGHNTVTPRPTAPGFGYGRHP